MNTESGSALLAVSAKPLSPEELRRMEIRDLTWPHACHSAGPVSAIECVHKM